MTAEQAPPTSSVAKAVGYSTLFDSLAQKYKILFFILLTRFGNKFIMKKLNFVLIFLAIIFLVIYIWSTVPVDSGTGISNRFDWPDEVANYFWSVNYASTGQLVVAEPLNQIAQNQIHPRSFNVRADGALVPGSFLGLILLFGTLAKIFSTNAIIYFTPVLSILAVLAFYHIIKHFFDRRVGLIAAVLMFFHPAWWYYSVTSMLPNVAFVSFLIFSIFFLLKNERIKSYNLLLSAFFGGLAISIRPSEIIWVAVIYLTLLFYLKQKLNYKKIIIFGVLAVIVVLPSLSQQYAIYGNYLTSGYSQLAESTQAACTSCSLVKSIISPFGFHPSLIAKNFWLHFVSRMWWLSLLALLGFVAYISSPKVQSSKSFGFMLMSMFVFAWLAIYYGSWLFSDQLTVHLNTLGLSYVRYWLPLYLMSLPFIAIGLLWLSGFLKNRWRNIILVLMLIILFNASVNLVLSQKPDSILPVKNRISTYKQNASTVNMLTEVNSVIITVRKDKLFFPDRKVIHTFEALTLNKDLQNILPGLIEAAPVYYYALGPEPALEFENGITLELVQSVGQEILYKVK